ncbi:hypothetical protein K1719_013782 [Acacia pycnantha]|nr:hypothetical protein K1719_013782 [Acacia pycnantha]
MGYLPQAMVNYLALLGWGDGTEEFFTMEKLDSMSCFHLVDTLFSLVRSRSGIAHMVDQHDVCIFNFHSNLRPNTVRQQSSSIKLLFSSSKGAD